MQDTSITLDATDKALLAALQRDAHLTSDALGQILNLSASQAGRRRQRLEAAGVIVDYRARLSARAVGLSVQAFVSVQLASQDPQKVRPFLRMIETRGEIMSAWTLTGEADYLLRVYCEDLSALNRLIHDSLLAHPAVARVQSQIVMDQQKVDAPLPL